VLPRSSREAFFDKQKLPVLITLQRQQSSNSRAPSTALRAVALPRYRGGGRRALSSSRRDARPSFVDQKTTPRKKAKEKVASK
jgi:hypothetical protein